MYFAPKIKLSNYFYTNTFPETYYAAYIFYHWYISNLSEMIFLPHGYQDEITDYCLSCRSSITSVGAMRVCMLFPR